VLNVSRHGPGQHLVTGRVWETVAAGALLIEQDNPATAHYFVPYRHYLPWRSIEEIVHLAHFIERRPDAIARIAGDAHAWASARYGADRFWSTLLDHALRPLPPGHGEAAREAARSWVPVFDPGQLDEIAGTAKATDSI
jgi:hypothetical protein